MKMGSKGFSLWEVCIVTLGVCMGVGAYLAWVRPLARSGSIFFELLGVSVVCFAFVGKILDVWQNRRRDKEVNDQTVKF